MAKWSKQTYEMVTEVLAGPLRTNEGGEGGREVVAGLAADFAIIFNEDNPDFDTVKFLETIIDKRWKP